MSVVRSPVASPVRSPVRAITGSGGSGGSLTALAQILALEPVALWWPTEGSGWQGRTGGDLSAVGSPVGILPDLSELGGATLDEWLAAPTTPELVTNGTFDTDVSGWTASNAALSVDTGRLRVENTTAAAGLAYQVLTVAVGRTYRFVGTKEAGTATGPRFYLGTSIGGTQYLPNAESGSIFKTTSSTLVVTATTQSNTLGHTAFFDNISVRELPGIHAIAPTDAARPLLGRVPVTGRRNLLTYTEQFDNGVWVNGSGVSKSGNTLTFTASSTDRRNAVYYSASVPSVSGENYVLRAQFTVDTGSEVIALGVKSSGSAIFGWLAYNTATDTSLGTYTVSTPYTSITLISATQVSPNVWELIVSIAANGAIISPIINFGSNGQSASDLRFASNGSGSITVTKAQLETGSTATAYQRVVTALDVTEAGVAEREYLDFDAVDDQLAGTLANGTYYLATVATNGTVSYTSTVLSGGTGLVINTDLSALIVRGTDYSAGEKATIEGVFA